MKTGKQSVGCLQLLALSSRRGSGADAPGTDRSRRQPKKIGAHGKNRCCSAGAGCGGRSAAQMPAKMAEVGKRDPFAAAGQ